MDKEQTATYFSFFTEIGILDQLVSAGLEARFPAGLLMSHFTVINHLVRVGDGGTPLALARAFQVPKTTMTHTLAGLVKHGLAEMRPNPKDKRSKQVWLTEEGRSFRKVAIATAIPVFERVSRKIPAERLAEVLPLLQELRELLDEDRDAKD